jgi:hypothetical protein
MVLNGVDAAIGSQICLVVVKPPALAGRLIGTFRIPGDHETRGPCCDGPHQSAKFPPRSKRQGTTI